MLVSGQPRVMGVREILQGADRFPDGVCPPPHLLRLPTVKEKRLHLLKGLAAILLDIDKAIHIIRTTEEETWCFSNLDDRLWHRRGAG